MGRYNAVNSQDNRSCLHNTDVGMTLYAILKILHWDVDTYHKSTNSYVSSVATHAKDTISGVRTIPKPSRIQSPISMLLSMQNILYQRLTLVWFIVNAVLITKHTTQHYSDVSAN